MFSRVPQKRGPSKGYIKELADRINSIEGKLASEGGHVDNLAELLGGPRRESDIFTPVTQADENNRKRPFSNISVGEFNSPTPSRQATWSSEPRPIQPYQPDRFRPAYSVNNLAPMPIAPKSAETNMPVRPSTAIDGMSIDINHTCQTRDLNGGSYIAYLGIIHPIFPLLSEDKTRIESLLAKCPSILCDAFMEAFYGTVCSFHAMGNGEVTGDIGMANRILTEWDIADRSQRKLATNLLYLQTLILMAISADNFGPAALRGDHGGASKASILGRAVGLAYSMRLHTAQAEASAGTDVDLDLDESLAMRAWWTLVMLDRWNAISTGSPLFIPNDSVVILPSLNNLLGDAYPMARLCNILGHFSPVVLAPPRVMSPESGAATIVSSLMNLAIELFREVLPPTTNPTDQPILHLVYFHCRLLTYLFQTTAKSSDVMWPCGEIIGLLKKHSHTITPLNHHFFALTTLALIELTKVDVVRDEANMLLTDLLESNVAPSNWDGIIRDYIADKIRPTTAQASVMEATASQGLQHLADLATATETMKPDKGREPSGLRTSDNYSDMGFDPRPLTRGGYLNMFSA